MDPKTVPLTPRAMAFIEAFDETLGPKYDCQPNVMPTLIVDPYDFRIEAEADRMLFTYEKDDIVRTIWLGAHPEPKAGDYTLQGHSHGRYEGDELVIETTKFAFHPNELEDTNNLPSSTMKRVVERYRREGQRLKLDVTTEDPLILQEPFRFTYEWETSDKQLIPYDCDVEQAQMPRQYLPPAGVNAFWATGS
jgi:hypothetical protein